MATRKKMKSGGRTSLDHLHILSHMESCKLDTRKHSLSQIVEHLRSSYPEYRRIKLQPFTRHIHHILDYQKSTTPTPSCKRRSNEVNEEDDVGDKLEPLQKLSHKKVRKSDSEEGRLEKAEPQCLVRRSKQRRASSESCCTLDEGAASSSEDVVFEEPFEPEVDLMKTLIRSNYSASKLVSTGKTDQGKIIEVEMTEKACKIDSVDDIRAEMSQNCLKVPLDTKLKKKCGPRFRDLGGMKNILDELWMKVIVPLKYPELMLWFGAKSKTGILLHGPPGCGKTKLVEAIANETGVPFYKISATQLVSGVSGASEENIRDLFSKAYRTAPSIVFIDEIDCIASKRENLQREMERRMVTQLMTCMDESHRTLGQTSNKGTDSIESEKKPGYVLVIGATNRPDAIDPALRRPGRFDREIVLDIPDEQARVEILSVVTRNLRFEGTFDLKKLATLTAGFVGADLVDLADQAAELAISKIFEERKSDFFRALENEDDSEGLWNHPLLPEEVKGFNITMADFEAAILKVQPSLRREGFSSIPNVTWEDVGGLNSLRKELYCSIIGPIKHPDKYTQLGLDLEAGFLLYGPPGCGKTLIAQAVANEAGANFIYVKGAEILNKYVGESELGIRTIFRRAHSCAPCIVFFDEVDALTANRGNDGAGVVDRVLNQLLIELDGVHRRKGVYIIGATNRLEIIDPAVCRTGRFGEILYVPLPSPDERVLILRALTRSKPIAADVDLDAIGRSDACKNLSGSDLRGMVMKAGKAAVEEGEDTIKMCHFEHALKTVTPSVKNKQKKHYDAVFRRFKMA